mmetsp:Transcript_28793/g.57416  ORF Transcript_28793/g.57416 Transcript_28793/m.57416 type:complete len:117 (-) Transcript_28793:80-430(-)
MWNAGSKKCLHTFSGHTESVHSIVYVPTGNTLLTASSDTTIKMGSSQVDSDAGEDTAANNGNVEEATTNSESDVDRGSTEMPADVANTEDVEVVFEAGKKPQVTPCGRRTFRCVSQ